MSVSSNSKETELYKYTPNQIVPIIAAVLFGSSAIMHLVVMMRKRTLFYSPLVAGAIMMTMGYAMRFLSAKNPNSIPLYAGQNLLLILPPSLYAATIYMIYGRIVIFVKSPEASVIRPTRVTKIFVLGDVVSFFMQAGGGTMMAQASSAKLGQKVILGGLFAQLLFFGFFLVIAVIFKRRMAQPAHLRAVAVSGRNTWCGLLILLMIAAVLIILRCLYRVAEFAMGMDGYLMKHEVFMYVADMAPMLFVQVLFHIVHAGDVFPEEFVAGNTKIVKP
ncbi:RTA1 like protein-domain-containing protein [Bisporella sp. PMI_857]|nr:RTA1 like protein-domain-containing protein [Bisporella sp. PMI_857]